jgi:hypothetical protein
MINNILGDYNPQPVENIQNDKIIVVHESDIFKETSQLCEFINTHNMSNFLDSTFRDTFTFWDYDPPNSRYKYIFDNNLCGGNSNSNENPIYYCNYNELTTFLFSDECSVVSDTKLMLLFWGSHVDSFPETRSFILQLTQIIYMIYEYNCVPNTWYTSEGYHSDIHFNKNNYIYYYTCNILTNKINMSNVHFSYINRIISFSGPYSGVSFINNNRRCDFFASGICINYK